MIIRCETCRVLLAAINDDDDRVVYAACVTCDVDLRVAPATLETEVTS